LAGADGTGACLFPAVSAVAKTWGRRNRL